MECGHYRSQINRYVDGELGYVEVAELQRHLNFCERCAVELAELGGVRRELTRLAGVDLEPSPGFAERVTAVCLGEARPGRRSLPRSLDERLHDIDEVLGRVSLPGGRTLPVRSLLGWALAAAALLIGIERRYLRRSRQLRPS